MLHAAVPNACCLDNDSFTSLGVGAVACQCPGTALEGRTHVYAVSIEPDVLRRSHELLI
jgi:hypothetical protein